MDGIFLKKKRMRLIPILGIIIGVFQILLFSALLWVYSVISRADAATGIGVGAVIAVFFWFSLQFNHGAYLHLTADGISAKFGWRQRIRYAYDELAFVEYNRFSLFFSTKSGKQYTILNLLNADEICNAIRREMHAGTKGADKEHLLSEIRGLTARRNREILWIIVLCFLLFFNIFLCAFLTGWKDASDFIRRDRIIFAVFALLELCLLVFLFCLAPRAGRKRLILNGEKTMLRKQILETAPVPPGNFLCMYVDVNYWLRAVIYGFPNEKEVYFSVETIDQNYELIFNYRSQIFDGIEELTPMLQELIEVEEPVNE